jgi:hypothetical protein
MHNSEPAQARRFLRLFAGAAAAAAALALGLTYAVDPLGLLHGEESSLLCAPGIEFHEERQVKLLLAAVHRPDEIVLGSSRVQGGFDQAAVEQRVGGRVANLAVAGAAIADIDLLARTAVERAPIRRIWIGLDFGAFVQPAPAASMLRAPPDLPPDLLAWRAGLLDPVAVEGAVTALVDPRRCRAPEMTAMGFQARAYQAHAGSGEAPSRRWRDHMDRAWRLQPETRQQRYDHALARIDALAEHFRARGVRLVLFLSPVHPDYASSIAGAELAPLYARWRRDLQALARRRGAQLLLTDTPDFLPSAEAACPGARRDCLFNDPIHFRPILGDAIIAEGLGQRR